MTTKRLDWIAPTAITILLMLNIPAFAGKVTSAEDDVTLKTIEVASALAPATSRFPRPRPEID